MTAPSTPFDAREALYEHFARVGQAMASPARLRLLSLLGHGEKPVEVLAERTGQSLAAASAHLKVLRAVGLVHPRRQGRHIYYRLASPEVLGLWLAVRQVAERHLPEVRELVRLFQQQPEELEQLPVDEVLRLVEEGRVLLLDLRPGDEFAAGHLPRALSMPFGELEQRLLELPADRRIVAYCRGPYCLMAHQAISVLRRHGLLATRLEEGAVEWRAAGRELSVPS